MTPSASAVQRGIGTIEFLIAILLFSIVVTVLTQFQSNLQQRWHQQNMALETERLAFMQLEIYPDQLSYDRQQWRYQQQRLAYTLECDLIRVKFIHRQGYQSQQQRLWCSKE